MHSKTRLEHCRLPQTTGPVSVSGGGHVEGCLQHAEATAEQQANIATYLQEICHIIHLAVHH
jgi:hypothetical protein